MTLPIYTDLRTIMGAAQTWLTTSLDWTPERVIVNDPAFVKNFNAEQYVIIWFAGSRITMRGGGRADTLEDIDLSFTLRTRYAVDDATSGLAWLTDAEAGHSTERHQILDALSDHVLKDHDPDGNWLTVRGLLPKGSPRIQRSKPDSSWGESVLTFSAQYRLAFTTPYVPW